MTPSMADCSSSARMAPPLTHRATGFAWCITGLITIRAWGLPCKEQSASTPSCSHVSVHGHVSSPQCPRQAHLQLAHQVGAVQAARDAHAVLEAGQHAAQRAAARLRPARSHTRGQSNSAPQLVNAQPTCSLQ